MKRLTVLALFVAACNSAEQTAADGGDNSIYGVYDSEFALTRNSCKDVKAPDYLEGTLSVAPANTTKESEITLDLELPGLPSALQSTTSPCSSLEDSTIDDFACEYISTFLNLSINLRMYGFFQAKNNSVSGEVELVLATLDPPENVDEPPSSEDIANLLESLDPCGIEYIFNGQKIEK